MARAYNSKEWAPWEQNASPILLVLTLNAGMRELKQYFGMGLWTSVIIFEDNQGKWLFRPKELKLLGQKMIDFLLCPPYRVAFNTGYQKTEQTVLQKARDIQLSTDLDSFTNDELVALFEDFSQTYYDWYKYGWFCEPVQFQSEDLLTTWMEKEDKEKQLPFDITEMRQVVFTIEEDTFAVEILRHLSECARVLGGALKNQRFANAIKEVARDNNFANKASQITLSMIESDEDGDLTSLRDMIKEHSAKFYWKRNNYFSTQFITEKNVLVELFSSDKLNISDPALQFENELRGIQENKEKALSRKSKLLGVLPPYYRNLVALMSSVGGSLIDKRKRTIMIANGAFDRILSVIANRTNTEISDCRLLIPQELRDFVSSPEEYHQRFEERQKQFLVFQGDFPLLDELFGDVANEAVKSELNYSIFSMIEPFIAEGKQVEKALEQLDSRLNILSQTTKTPSDRLQGVVTYYNSIEPEVVGVVNVIRNPKTESLKSGGILVAPSTTPDYMDAIRKCKAIVTDWGGQTSHAAIVSRELQKPCIIGTNYASQVLRNGDKVRLNLKEGIVEIVK